MSTLLEGDLRSVTDSKTVSNSEPASGTLRPSEEIQEEEGNGIDRDVWIDTRPFTPCSLPGSSCSEPPRATEGVHTKDELHTSPDYGDAFGNIPLRARKTTSDAVDSIVVPQALSSRTSRIVSKGVPLRTVTRNSFRRHSASEAEIAPKSNACHQASKDKRRTPARRPTIEARPESLCTSSDSSDKLKKQEQLVFDAGKTGLLYTLTGRKHRERPKTAVLNLVALQRMNIHNLQTHLAYHAAWSFDVGRSDRDPRIAQKLLNLYCDAIRNIDFMREAAKLGYHKDPFLIKSSRALERGALETSGLIPDHLLPKGELPPSVDHEHPLLWSGSGRHHANEKTMKKQRLERFAMASFGGLLIIVPMLIMANVPGKVASLVTSCVAIIIFAGLITLGTKLGPHEVLASVAAYAAVLVVFVGLSLEKR